MTAPIRGRIHADGEGAPSVRIERTRLPISVDDTTAEIDTGLGSGVLSFRVGDRDVLRPSNGLPDDPRLQAMFVIAPWVNRIDGGRFFSGDDFVSLRPNVPKEPNPIHGQAWLAPWELAELRDDEVLTRFQGGGDDWPWPYSLQQRISVESGRLDCELTIHNLAETPMPAGIGFHPYFERPARLTATVDGTWQSGPGGLPDRWEPHEQFRSTDVDGIIADESYTGWDGRAVIETPSWRVDLSSTLDLLHLYTPRGRNYFCVEPVSAAPDAVNHDQRGLRLLAPGEQFTASMRLSVRLR